MFASELEPDHELDSPRGAGANRAVVQNAGDAAKPGGRTDVPAGIAVYRMVEKIEGFRPEADVGVFGEPGALFECAVDFVITGSSP